MSMQSFRRDSSGPDSADAVALPSSSSSSSGQARVAASSAGTISAETSALLRDGKITQQLAEIAFIGAFNGRTQAAETIFRSLRLLCPGNPHVELGLAMVCAIDGRPGDGLEILERIPLPVATQLAASSQGLGALCQGLMLQEAGHPVAAERKFIESLAQGGESAGLARDLVSVKRRG